MAPAMDKVEPARKAQGLDPAEAESCRTIVIVGNGMVGHRLCERLTGVDAPVRYRVVVFGEETRPAYDRIHLTDPEATALLGFLHTLTDEQPPAMSLSR